MFSRELRRWMLRKQQIKNRKGNHRGVGEWRWKCSLGTISLTPERYAGICSAQWRENKEQSKQMIISAKRGSQWFNSLGNTLHRETRINWICIPRRLQFPASSWNKQRGYPCLFPFPQTFHETKRSPWRVDYCCICVFVSC